MTDHNEKEQATREIHLSGGVVWDIQKEKTEMTSVEYLRYCKDKIAEYDEEQRILGNKINHWIGVINRTSSFRIG